ncbi:neuritin-like protein [Xenopus tropicalis]|uniref:Neuritin 1 like n=1 Tax=Xenopus tropicalis TaxID=8364 RepID=A0A803J9U9_XENTR|nr:neuritin-like protein [Xenopus tropicalis]
MTISFWGEHWIMPVLLIQLVLAQSPVNAASSKCNTIYKGFAECLVSFGDSLIENVQQNQEEKILENIQELHSLCKSWNEFQKCTSNVLVNCPEEAATVWESLLRESRKIQYQGNLHGMCSAQTLLTARMGGSDETNKETLRALGCGLRGNLLHILFLFILLLQVFQWI